MATKNAISLNGKTILVTGSPGFIGANLVIRLLRIMSSGTVISFDNLNSYYDPRLKKYRLRMIEEQAAKCPVSHIFIEGSIADKALVDKTFARFHPDIVVNLAAQAGVRASIDHPDAYIESNIIGFYNILEACRHSYDSALTDHEDSNSSRVQKGHDSESELKENHRILEYPESIKNKRYQGVQNLIFASSSSVYGNTDKIPFSTEDKVDAPVSLYAATKKSNELLAHAYSKLYNIPCTGLRFFTVYGPAGRPDMFYYAATEKLTHGESIKIFNYGDCKRDFTYIDDIVEGIVRVMQGSPGISIGKDGLPVPPYALYNIGKGRPENLLDFICVLQEELIKCGLVHQDYDFEVHKEFVPMQPGDVAVTYADTSALERDYGYRPETDIRTGLRAFVEWYINYRENIR